MEFKININDCSPDNDKRSLRFQVKNRPESIFRDTYFMIDPETSPSHSLKLGQTIIYPTGMTTGHSHDDLEEVYYVVSGSGVMQVGDDEYPIHTGDAQYVPPGEFHTTRQTGNVPLVLIWVTCSVSQEYQDK